MKDLRKRLKQSLKPSNPLNAFLYSVLLFIAVELISHASQGYGLMQHILMDVMNLNDFLATIVFFIIWSIVLVMIVLIGKYFDKKR